MTQTHAAAPASGGQFLTSDAVPAEVFVREDLSEEQRLFGRTASEFMHKEVLPVVEKLYHHDWALTRELLKKASELDLLRLEIPPAYGGLGLDLISASYVGEQIAINPSFGGSLGAHTSIGTLPLVYFGTEEQKARYLPRLASGELIGTNEIDGKFTGVAQLGQKLASSETVRQCMARQWFRFALSRFEQSVDDCSMQGLVSAFEAAGSDLNALPKAIVQSDAFVYRHPVDSEIPQ